MHPMRKRRPSPWRRSVAAATVVALDMSWAQFLPPALRYHDHRQQQIVPRSRSLVPLSAEVYSSGAFLHHRGDVYGVALWRRPRRCGLSRWGSCTKGAAARVRSSLGWVAFAVTCLEFRGYSIVCASNRSGISAAFGPVLAASRR